MLINQLKKPHGFFKPKFLFRIPINGNSKHFYLLFLSTKGFSWTFYQVMSMGQCPNHFYSTTYGSAALPSPEENLVPGFNETAGRTP